MLFRKTLVMNIKNLEKFIKENNIPKYRLQQIKQAIYQEACLSFAEISTLPKDLKSELGNNIKILSLSAEKVLVATNKKSAKVLFAAVDGNKIESVIMKNSPNRWTVCLSVQAGCPIGCPYCATGQGGFKRNLTSEEISDQLLFWQNYLSNNFPE
ncbi:MAG: hypothetical protein NTW06_01100, partial [Candidatus Falkowbacteria bacterium]|nr:hypothetical protein [Candidatus Falkowbacteria bacterium]